MDACDLLLGHLTGAHAGRSKGDEERRVLQRPRLQRRAGGRRGDPVRPRQAYGVTGESDLGVGPVRAATAAKWYA